MVNREWSLDELRSKAEAYCVRAEHCCAEVQIKLQQWGATEAQQQIILDDLQQNHYIDHARYCQAFAHDKLLYQGWGKMKIRAALCARRLSDSEIEKALDSIDKIEYNRIPDRDPPSLRRCCA